MVEPRLRTRLPTRSPLAGANTALTKTPVKRIHCVARATSGEDEQLQRVEVQATTKSSRPKALTFLSANTERVFAKLLPEYEGDAKDWLWMIASTLVFVYLAACLFMIYEHFYYRAGFVTIADLMTY